MKFCWVVAAVAVLAACSDDEEEIESTVLSVVDSGDISAESYVYRERDSKYPLILSRPRDRVLYKTRAVGLSFDDILGRTLKLTHFPYENMQNIGEPVINLTKLGIDHPAWATKILLRESASSAFSYSTFERYEENSTITKKINSGFQLNFGLFKLGNKTTYYHHFAKSLLESSNSVFGQLDIEIRDAIFNLEVNSNRLSQIRTNYIEKDFLDDLHNLHPYETFTFYGPLVMMNFVTGGRASALFAGVTKTSTTVEGREKTLKSEISSSFSIKNSTDSISLGIGKGFTNGNSSTKAFTQLETTLVTLGGAYGFGAFTTPKSIDNMNIDLSSWASSLNDAGYQTIINIQDNGLIPLSGFFIEENLKIQYERYVTGEVLPSKNYIEPKLVSRSFLNHQAGQVINIMYLITRLNDAIAISHNSAPINYPQGIEIFDVKFDRLCNLYKIKAEKLTMVFPYKDFNTEISISDPVLNMSFNDGFLETYMKKYLDVDNGMIYLLYNENDKKVGYSIYIAKGDYLLDTYGIREWVEKLPSITINKKELEDYKLIAL